MIGSTIDKLMSTLRTRRDAQAKATVSGYEQLVVALANGIDIDAAHADAILSAAGRDEPQLRADVSRIMNHREQAARARKLPAIRKAVEQSSAAVDAARREREEQLARLNAKVEQADAQHATALRAESDAADALTTVLASAPAHLREAHEAAVRASNRAKGDVHWLEQLRDGSPQALRQLRSLDDATLARARTAFDVFVAAGTAVTEAEQRVRAAMPMGLEPEHNVDKLREGLDAAKAHRQRVLAQLAAVADAIRADVERSMPALQKAVDQALKAVLASEAEVTRGDE